MNDALVDLCEWCDQSYCWNCADSEDYKRFCSKKCEREFKEDEEREASHD